jgi:hypothetical protein
MGISGAQASVSGAETTGRMASTSKEIKTIPIARSRRSTMTIAMFMMCTPWVDIAAPPIV